MELCVKLRKVSLVLSLQLVELLDHIVLGIFSRSLPLKVARPRLQRHVAKVLKFCIFRLPLGQFNALDLVLKHLHAIHPLMFGVGGAHTPLHGVLHHDLASFVNSWVRFFETF